MWSFVAVAGILRLLPLVTCDTCPINPTTCVVLPCAAGESTFLTCYFHKDTQVTKDGIIVKHYPVGSSSTDLGKDALNCYWVKGSEIPTCTAGDGYQFDGNITDRLTLEVPHVSRETEGRYACHVLSPDVTVVHKCELEVLERPRHLPSTVPSSTESTQANDGFAGQCTPTDHRIASVVFAAVAGCQIIFIMGVVCLPSTRNRIRRFCSALSKQDSDHQENDCAQKMLSDMEIQSTEPIPTQSRPAYLHSETSEASSQTDKTELVDKSVTALLCPDQDTHLKQNTSTPGNILDKSTVLRQTVTTHTQCDKDQGGCFEGECVPSGTTGIAGLRRRRRLNTHPSPGDNSDGAETSEQALLSDLLDSDEFQAIQQRNEHDYRAMEQERAANKNSRSWFMRFFGNRKKEKHSLDSDCRQRKTTGNVLEKENPRFRNHQQEYQF